MESRVLFQRLLATGGSVPLSECVLLCACGHGMTRGQHRDAITAVTTFVGPQSDIGAGPGSTSGFRCAG